MKFLIRKDLLAYGIILFFVVVGLWALIRNPFYTSHDGFTHTARIMAYYEALKDGQFPPRWATKFSGNLGSPIFVYSYPLPYFLGSLLHFGRVHYQDSFRLVLGGGYLLSGLTAFWWLSKRFGKVAGLVGAVFYLWAPYRFLNIYVRAALAESFAYTFIPLVFLAIDQLFTNYEKKWWYLLVFSASGLLLSHNLVAAMFLPAALLLIAVYTVFLKKVYHGLISIFAIVMAFLMSSFIYLPDLFERGYVHFDEGISYWQNHFVAWWQLIRSHWGYGFDFPGTVNDDMSFQLGLTQILVTGLLALLLGWLIKKKHFKFKSVVNVEGLFFLTLLGGAIFLMLDEPLIVPLWKVLPFIKTIIDFPWRFLGMTVIAFSFLAAYFIHLTKNSKILATVLVALVIIANRNHVHINEALSFTDQEIEGYHGTSTAESNEYNPIWHKSNDLPGDLVTANAVNNALGMKVTLPIASTGARLNRFYFPKTSIYRDGNELKLGRDYEIISQKTDSKFDDTGLIWLNKPLAGEYLVKFEETPLRKLANILSLTVFSIISLGLFRELYASKVAKR